MSYLVRTRLINGPFDDPGLFVDFRFGRRAFLFDLGDLTALSAREVLRITDIFVSHRHMDHFSGFDRLLRLALYRPSPIRIVGPPGLIEGVDAKLRAYSWNLLDEKAVDFSLTAAEFENGRLREPTVFFARDGFASEPGANSLSAAGLVLKDGDVRIECVTLDHGIPCLAFALQERLRVNVLKAGLDAMGLTVGPWLNAAKSAMRRGEPDEMPVETGNGPTVPLGALRERAFRVAHGQRVAYVTDAAFTPQNAEQVIEIARDADQLYIEAAFLDEDAAIAAARRHLTARQAGSLAARAKVKRLSLFHHSPRYLHRPESLRKEAEHAFISGLARNEGSPIGGSPRRQ